jgi:DnaK suppressor protein
MDQASLQAYRQRLLDQQRMMVRRIYTLEEELQETSTPEIAYDDRSQLEEPEEVLEQLDEQSRREAEDIQAALERIEHGTFGNCEACGEPIDRARLDALPTARRCVSCQERSERTAKP